MRLALALPTAPVLLVTGAALVAACSQAPQSETNVENAETNVENAMAMNVLEGSDAIINAMKAEANPHNYAIKEGQTYGYIAAVSEDEAKAGKAAGDVSMFAFRGVVDGLYRISSLDDEGRTDLYYECEKPCVVIKRHFRGEVTRLAYTPTSVIGAAFEDALNGRLEVFKEPRDSRAAPRAETSTSNIDGGTASEPESPNSVAADNQI